MNNNSYTQTPSGAALPAPSKYANIRRDTIAEFRASLPKDKARELSALLWRHPEHQRARFVRQMLEIAFVAASTMNDGEAFDGEELLFSIAALPHDTCLDSRIEELADQPDEAHMLFSWWEQNYGRDLANAVRGLCGVPA